MRRILTVVALAVVAAGCSASTADRAAHEWRYGPIPTCDTTSRGRLLLMAQSVPEATLIPCIDDLPAGWEMVAAHSRTGESTLVFTTDTFDLEVDVALTPVCNISSAQPGDSTRPGTELFIAGDEASWSFVFEGGCITFDYDTSRLARTGEGVALMDAIRFMPRDVLRAITGWIL